MTPVPLLPDKPPSPSVINLKTLCVFLAHDHLFRIQEHANTWFKVSSISQEGTSSVGSGKDVTQERWGWIVFRNDDHDHSNVKDYDW